MDIKESLFLFFLILSVSVPFFFKKENIKNITNRISLPDVVVINGKFAEFNPKLVKEGHFKKLSYFNNNNFNVDSVFVKFNEENLTSTITAKKMVYNGVFNFFDLIYQTNSFKYYSKNTIYDDKNGIITAKNIQFEGFK